MCMHEEDRKFNPNNHRVEAVAAPSLVINAPAIFADPEFCAWLNGDGVKFTWHQGGKPDDYSDTVVMVDPGLNGEGTDSDMPEHIWSFILAQCRQHFAPSRLGYHIMVRLTNLDP